MLDEVRVHLRWNDGALLKSVGSRAPEADIMRTLKSIMRAHERLDRNPPIIVDAETAVPWRDVVRVVDDCRIAGWRSIEFGQPIR